MKIKYVKCWIWSHIHDINRTVHQLWITWKKVPHRFLIKAKLLFSALSQSCCDSSYFNDRPSYEYDIVQKSPSPRSSSPTFINILLVSLGSTNFIQHHKRSLLLLLFKSLIFIVTKNAFFWAHTLQKKTNIGGSLSQRLPWLQSHLLMTGFILCYHWLCPLLPGAD